MKKKRFIILLSILAAVIVIGCFAYMYFTASAARKFVINDKNREQLYQLPEHIEIGNKSRPGYTVHFQDYSITISGYNDVVIEDLNDDFYTKCHVEREKIITFQEYKVNFGRIPSLQFEKAAGRKIDTAYDFLDASFKCTPNDFSLLDAEKNKGVSLLLETKYDNMGRDCYQFNNGVVKGYISIILPQDIATSVLFSKCDGPDSCYEILFVRFSIDEVKEMLGTVSFDGGN